MRNGRDRLGKIVAVANMKGGVGKSTTVVSLAEAMAADDLDASVLVVDLDPQASASVCIAGDNLLSELIEREQTFEAFLDRRLLGNEKVNLQPLVRDQISDITHQGQTLDLSLLPCGPNLRLVERDLIYELAGRHEGVNSISGKIMQVFTLDFGALRKTYDYIIFDCAPGLSPVSEAAVRIADLVLVPTIPDFLSVYGLNAFHGSIWVRPSALPKPKSMPHILITRLQLTRQHKEICEKLAREATRPENAYRLLLSVVPQAAGLADALMRVGNLTYTRKYTPAIIDKTLTPLVEEIKELL